MLRYGLDIDPRAFKIWVLELLWSFSLKATPETSSILLLYLRKELSGNACTDPL